MHMIGDEYVEAIAGYIVGPARDFAIEKISDYLKARGQAPTSSNVKKAQIMTSSYPKRRRYGTAGFGRRRPSNAMIPYRNRGFTRVSGNYGRYSSLMPGEMKFHDIDVDDGSILTGGTILNSGTINIIAQGNTESTRIGRKSVIKAINWRWQIRLSIQDAGATPREPETVRLILYLDKQCNGATATILDILDTANYQSFNQLANKNRFRILMDKMIDINPKNLASDGAGLVSSSAQKISGSYYKKCNIPIEFDNSATTGVITSMRSNNLGVLSIADVGSITQLDSKFRLRFTDS